MTRRPRAISFRRVVIGFRDTFGSASSLAAAAGFARLLETELVGIFIEDEELMEWAASSFARRVPATATEPARTPPAHEESATAAGMMRQRLSRAATSCGLIARFQTERASAASLDLRGVGPDDLLVVVEPADPLARQSYPFTATLEAMIRHPAPVLYVPCHVRPRPDPCVAVAGHVDETVRQLAEAIADKLGAQVVELHDTPNVAKAAGERLIVFDRDTLPEDDLSSFATIAAEHGAPALIVGTGRRQPDTKQAS